MWHVRIKTMVKSQIEAYPYIQAHCFLKNYMIWLWVVEYQFLHLRLWLIHVEIMSTEIVKYSGITQGTTTTDIHVTAASWSSGRVQDSGLGSRSSPGFNTLPVWLLVVPLSKALHAALLLSTQEEMGTCEGRFVSRGAKLRVSGCILPRELRWLSIRIWTVKGPMTREGTCQSLQSRALSLDVDSKQWLYFTLTRGPFYQYGLRYPIPKALVYHSKYAFQISWKKQSSYILFKASQNDNLISRLCFFDKYIFFWPYLFPWQPYKIWFL